MRRALIAAASVVAVCAAASAAMADGRYDVEHARANARAGGPVSEYDYELLERWGHLSEIQPRYRHRFAPVYKRRYVHRDGYRWR